MSRNIKEIGKELMGKSLNSFHRKTGLTQLEKNNEMQDGILDGILSQVDDAYIEKTEQSNVIHLDGSGDGVVVLDSVEGNTMVNRMPKFNGIYTTTSEVIVPSFEAKYSRFGNIHCLDVTNMPRNITIISLGKGIGVEWLSDNENGNGVSWKGVISTNQTIKHTILDNRCTSLSFKLPLSNGYTSNDVKNIQILILEGDWTNREIPQYFEGLQSSFEEKVNDEGKYEIEILSNNKNLYNGTYEIGSISTADGKDTQNGTNRKRSCYIKVKPNTTYTIKQNVYTESDHELFVHQYNDCKNNPQSIAWDSSNVVYLGVRESKTFTTSPYTNYIRFRTQDDRNIESVKIVISYANTFDFEPHKQNKIKLLLNEPLRAIDNIKDRLCIKDGKLVVERRCGEIVFDGSDDEIWDIILFNFVNHTKAITRNIPNLKGTDNYSLANSYCDKFIQLAESPNFGNDTQEYYAIGASAIEISINNSKLSSPNVNGIKKWLQQNPTKITYELKNPVYEEVLNEHGEPILLEGYENGTLYIDSTIIPTTSIRYTPKMESFKALKEVNNNNIMLTNDVNDNIIPYMMDVDLMIMEKEMALMSHKNIRTIGVKDMTSMQKRTQDMLTRLIKGKTLTEQECKTRVVTYLDAGKITDAQADELMLLISEVYA